VIRQIENVGNIRRNGRIGNVSAVQPIDRKQQHMLIGCIRPGLSGPEHQQQRTSAVKPSGHSPSKADKECSILAAFIAVVSFPIKNPVNPIRRGRTA
jgi:hypothetical protein